METIELARLLHGATFWYHSISGDRNPRYAVDDSRCVCTLCVYIIIYICSLTYYYCTVKKPNIFVFIAI